jgi:hypothetical protein
MTRQPGRALHRAAIKFGHAMAQLGTTWFGLTRAEQQSLALVVLLFVLGLLVMAARS